MRGPSTRVVIYGRRVRGHVVEGPWADALSDVVGRQLTLVERDDAGWATDLRPATLVSQASLGVIDGDGRRFRMLLEVDGLEAFEEEQWRNRRVRVGEAMLLITRPDAPLCRPVHQPRYWSPRPERPSRTRRKTRHGRRGSVPRGVRGSASTR